ncbi:MAG: phosphatase PAP2 family protein, partial [Bacteroidales bacterium]
MSSIVTFTLILALLAHPHETPTRPDRLWYRPSVDIPVTLVFGGVLAGLQLGNSSLAPKTCKWCDRAPDGSDALNGFDSWGRRNLKWNNTANAALWSSVTAYAFAPAVAYGGDFLAAKHDGRPRDALDDAVLISQSWFAASDVAQVIKLATARERPFIHVLPADQKSQAGEPSTNNESFPSGHAVLAFSLATSSAEIASLRGYRYAPWLWGLGLPVASLTA